jgi:toxin secretion/phage lysis holin
MNKWETINMFEFLRELIKTEDTKILFILGVICIAMVIDFLSGTIAAKINPTIEFKSKAGIDGILRKITSVILLVFFIPVSVLVPNNIGTALLYTLYVGYLIMELQSILENYKKMGGDSSLFQKFMDSLKNKKE